MYVCAYTYIYIYIYMCIRISTYIYIYIYICIHQRTDPLESQTLEDLCRILHMNNTNITNTNTMSHTIKHTNNTNLNISNR